MGNEIYCQKCYEWKGWTDKCDYCDVCIRYKKKKEEEEKREEEEEEKRIREEEEKRIREEKEKRIREEEEKRRNEKEEEKAQKGIRSLLNSISSSVNSIYLSDFKFKTSMANKKSVSLKNEKVCNLYCSMNTVGSTYSESIDTSLNRERIYEQKNNYLYIETDELSLDNLRTLKTGREKSRFTKKF